jgi:hypothetical protein
MPGSKIQQVPKGACWVETDRTSIGGDSSQDVSGAVPLALLKGRALCICFPPSRWWTSLGGLPPGRLIGRGPPRSADSIWRWTR